MFPDSILSFQFLIYVIYRYASQIFRPETVAKTRILGASAADTGERSRWFDMLVCLLDSASVLGAATDDAVGMVRVAVTKR